jgi:hypothetical protein
MTSGTIWLGKGYAKLVYDTSIDVLDIQWYNPSTSSYETKFRLKLSTGGIQILGSILQNLTINASIPRLYLTGTETGAKSVSIREDTGKAVVRDESAGVDLRNLLLLGALYVKSGSPTPGVSGAYGTAVNLAAGVNASIVPLSATLTWGGTFGTGETVTIRLTATFSDNTTQNITKSATATGTVTLNTVDLQGLFKDGVYITKISVDSSSSAASTSVTTSATVYGFTV